jgi:acid phosphatase type 7
MEFRVTGPGSLGKGGGTPLMGVQRLHWGCGADRPADWINVDSEDRPGIDFSCDIVIDGLPLATDSVDCAYGRHTLQRLKLWDLWSALRELYRVLKPGGVLRLSLADFDRALASYQNGRSEDFWARGWKTLSGKLISQIVEDGYISTPLNFELAEEMLRKAGFDEVRRAAYCTTNGCHPEIVELDRRRADSFYVEAFKRLASRPVTAAAGPATQIHLSWSSDPSTSLTVTWHTPAGRGAGFVEFRHRGCGGWTRIPAAVEPSPGRGVLRRATLIDLLPATTYEYRVSGDEGAVPAMSEVFLTRTAPPPGPGDFRFAFICDTGLIGRPDGNATGTRQVVEELLADDLLFVLGGGDYAYANRDRRYAEVGDAVDAWFVQMEPVIARRPFMAQFGNHEIFLTERFRDWAPRFAHSEGVDGGKCYSFDVGDVHFTALFAPGPTLSIEHVVWLNADLADARTHGARWLIVYQHEPIYGHGHSHPAQPELRRVLAPLFEKHRVDLHLSGHDQNYERTYPLLGVPAKPTPVSTALDRYEAGRGVVYAKVSPGGKLSEIRNAFSRFTTAQQPFVAVRDDTAHHYAVVSVRRDGELEVTTYSLVGDMTPKTVVDSFRIVLADARPIMDGSAGSASKR